MLKNKYQRMNKEEKKIIRNNFKNSIEGKNYTKRIKKIIIIAHIGIIYSIVMFFVDYLKKDLQTYFFISYIILFIASIIFIISSILLLNKEYNKYAIKK